MECSFNDTLGTFVNADGDNVTSCTNYTGAMEMTLLYPEVGSRPCVSASSASAVSD